MHKIIESKNSGWTSHFEEDLEKCFVINSSPEPGKKLKVGFESQLNVWKHSDSEILGWLENAIAEFEERSSREQGWKLVFSDASSLIFSMSKRSQASVFLSNTLTKYVSLGRLAGIEVWIVCNSIKDLKLSPFSLNHALLSQFAFVGLG